jgi:outer membrane usher protein
LSDRLTGELHAEATQNQMAAGVGGDALIPQFGTINAYVAGSQRQSTRGSLLLLGVDRQAQPWSIGARTLWTSSGFAQVGLPEGQMAPARVSTLNLSYSAARAGSIGLALVEQRNRDQPDSRILTVGYSIALGKFGNLSVSAVRNLIGAAETSVFAMLNIPLGAATSLSLSAQATRVGSYGGDSDFTATLQRNLPLGEGYGYRVQARSDGAREATVSMQNNTGTYSAGAAQFGGNTSTQLNATGGVGILGGDVFLSRRIDESFAVARIPDYPDVRLLADNQPAGRTDARGNALIPRLRAYDRNVIAIDQRDLPMDAEIGSLRREAIPYFRSGVEIIFPVRHSRGATFTVHLEDGSPLPLGAAVSIIGQDAVYTVGEGGEVYVAGLGPGNRLRAGWQDKRCEFDVDFTAGTDPLPDLGTFICKGVTP